MSDDNFLDGDVVDSATIEKGKGFSSLVPGLLKWILIALSAVILIVIVVFVTVKIVSNNTSNQTRLPRSEEVNVQREVLDWFQLDEPIRTRTSDDVPASVVVKVYLGYEKENKEASKLISDMKVQIVDYLRRYFSTKTMDELKPQKEESIKIEIRDGINDNILSSQKIREVTFQQFDVVEQF